MKLGKTCFFKKRFVLLQRNQKLILFINKQITYRETK